jgi:hypothetical protein
MDSDLCTFLYSDSPLAAQSSPSVRETLSPLPHAASSPPADEFENSPPHPTPAPYRSKLRPRCNTIASSHDKTVVEASQRALLAKKKLKRLEKQPAQSSPTVPGIDALSNESLVWDSSGLELTANTEMLKLWSTSTQFSVSIASPSSNISEMEHPVGQMSEPGPEGDPPSGAPPTDSQSTSGSISTTTTTATGETIRPLLPAPPPLKQLSSEQSSTHRDTAPPTSSDGGSMHSSARAEPPGSGRENDNRRWISLAHCTIARAKALVLPYKGKRLPTNVAAAIQQRAGKILDDLLDISERVSSPLREEVLQCIDDVATVTADLFDPDGGECASRSRTTSLIRSPSRSSESAATALLFSKTGIDYLLERIKDECLTDVRPGGNPPISPEMLRTIFDTQVPSVRHIIKECMDRTAKYAALPGADLELIDTAQTQCQNAEKWCDQVVSSYRSAQLHLEGNVASKEVTFKKFDPKGSVSVYEFLSRFDEWCSGYISDTSKPRLLYTKYLHPSLTTSYEELEAKKHDYVAMKNWLIDKFGSVKVVADNQLRAIRALKSPKPTDDALTHATYVR